MAMTAEGRVKHAVKKLLASIKAFFFMPVQNGMGRVGIPDFICCIPVTITPEMVGRTVGLFVAIETKAPGKCDQTTANQERELGSIRAANGVALVVDDAETARAALHRLGVYAYTTPQQPACPTVTNRTNRKCRTRVDK
jgi:hypothetical protein